MLSTELLEILACPDCKKQLQPAAEDTQKIICGTCGLAFPIRDGIPILLVSEADQSHKNESGVV